MWGLEHGIPPERPLEVREGARVGSRNMALAVTKAFQEKTGKAARYNPRGLAGRQRKALGSGGGGQPRQSAAERLEGSALMATAPPAAQLPRACLRPERVVARCFAHDNCGFCLVWSLRMGHAKGAGKKPAADGAPGGPAPPTGGAGVWKCLRFTPHTCSASRNPYATHAYTAAEVAEGIIERHLFCLGPLDRFALHAKVLEYITVPDPSHAPEVLPPEVLQTSPAEQAQWISKRNRNLDRKRYGFTAKVVRAIKDTVEAEGGVQRIRDRQVEAILRLATNFKETQAARSRGGGAAEGSA